MEAEVAAGLNLKKYMNREHYISTYPFQATRPLSVLFSIEIQVPLSAAIEIARGRPALQTQKADTGCPLCPRKQTLESIAI